MGVAVMAVVVMAISKQRVHLGSVTTGAPLASPKCFLQKGSSWRLDWQGSALDEIE